ncbi:MAG: hypothetical protein H6736_04805 [Alphaproteobacteria bacterium]|nr:hypothetical protein [Alphaproteobacteria bacterium]
MWVLLFACRPSVPVTPPPTPTAVTPPMPTGDTGGPTGECPLAPQISCSPDPGVGTIEGRVELRTLGNTVPICVAPASAAEGCGLFLGDACPGSFEEAIAAGWEDRGEEDRGGFLVRWALHAFPVQPVDGDPPGLVDDIGLFYREQGLIATRAWRAGGVSYGRDYCCSEGGSAQGALWMDEELFPCSEP